MTTTHNDPWATLPTNWREPPAPEPPPPPRLLHYDRPLPEWTREPATTCHPTCLRCSHPEGRGHCRQCVIVCDHSRQGSKRKLVIVCIVRIRAQARIAPGAGGRHLAIVRRCPHCHETHFHSAHPNASRYRNATCGQPYVLEIA